MSTRVDAGEPSCFRDNVRGSIRMDPQSIEADDFYVNLNVALNRRDLLASPETARRFFDRMKRAFPDLQKTYTRESGDLVMEGIPEQGKNRWVAVEPNRVCSGVINPKMMEESYHQHEYMLDIAPQLFAFGDIDCEALDVMFGFDFTCVGNHDEVVADVLTVGSSLARLLDRRGSRVLDFQPALTVALEDTYRLQARMSIETRTNAYRVRLDDFGDDQISLYFAVRQYWGRGPERSFLDAYRHQRAIGEEMLESTIIPRFVTPLSREIASRRDRRGPSPDDADERR